MSAFDLLQGRKRQEIQVYHQQLGDKARRSRFDLQIQVDHRADIQKAEAKLPDALLLLGNGKRDKDTGLVHADCPFAVKRGAGLVRGAKKRFQPSRHWCGYT